MQHLLTHTHLGPSAQKLFLEVVSNCPSVFREREIHWQLKMLSRVVAERDFFNFCLEQKSNELRNIFSHVRIAQVPPLRSIPMRLWVVNGLYWPDPVSFLTQIFLHQILSSSDLFLDLGSAADAFFISESRDVVTWVPESRGTRWHEPFRIELARLYLGWAFEQERLIDTALLALHLVPLKEQILRILSHWRTQGVRSVSMNRESLLGLFLKAEELAIYLHPNVLVWALYELEMIEVLAALDLRPDLERSADELCRSQSQISA